MHANPMTRRYFNKQLLIGSSTGTGAMLGTAINNHVANITIQEAKRENQEHQKAVSERDLKREELLKALNGQLEAPTNGESILSDYDQLVQKTHRTPKPVPNEMYLKIPTNTIGCIFGGAAGAGAAIPVANALETRAFNKIANRLDFGSYSANIEGRPGTWLTIQKPGSDLVTTLKLDTLVNLDGSELKAEQVRPGDKLKLSDQAAKDIEEITSFGTKLFHQVPPGILQLLMWDKPSDIQCEVTRIDQN